MADDDNDKGKTLAAGMKRLTTPQLTELVEAATAELSRRAEQEKRAKPPELMTDDEFRKWSADLMARAD